MKILFPNNVHIDIVLDQLPITAVLLSIFKHLQHATLPFKDWDNPFYSKLLTYDDLVKKLQRFGKYVGIDVITDRCYDQHYLNELHKIYETSYNGQPQWLDFHEHIHLCEYKKIGNFLNVMSLDYRELAGPLEKKFNPDWLDNSSTIIKAGDVYIEWAELGKSPYGYWSSQEPNNIDRLCQLAKPWLKLRPKLRVSLQDQDLLSRVDAVGFNQWWAQYHNTWCQHWNLQSWTLERHMYAAVVVGKITDQDTVIDLLKNRIHPVKVIL